ncbi:MAG: prepilin-type N-terminal cleavage/methylation domain-containing protein [Candidatus Omnitrophota bacterium]
MARFVMNRPQAFTFIELLVIILIIGVLAGLAAPRLRVAFDNFSLDNSVKDLYYLSRYLQGAAITSGKIHCLRFDMEKKQFQGLLKGNDTLINIDGKAGLAYSLPEEISVTFYPPEKSGMYFYPDGSIDKINITFSGANFRQASLVAKGAAGAIKIQ